MSPRYWRSVRASDEQRMDNWRTAKVDAHRMAKTGTGFGRSLSSAVL
jgi:hypothetical protein